MPEKLINFLKNKNIKLNLYKLIFLGEGKNKVYTDEKYIIKIGKKSNLQNEKEILEKIKNKIKAPIFEGFFEYNENFKGEYILILRLVKGIAVNKIWNSLGVYQKQEIAYSIIDELKKLHNLDKKKDEYIFTSELKNFQENYKKVMKNVKNLNKKKLEKYAREFADFLEKKGDLVLIHNDLWYKNIIVDEGKFRGFIDFELAKFSLKEAEYFRLKYHLFFAKLEESKVEIEFLEYLIGEMKKIYQDFTIYDNKIFRIYNIIMYFSLASKYEYSWYNQSDIDAFEKEFLLK
ncbi:MAG: phosphotransferase [Candidatus Gracilibacteria bacterium]|nr:phosphotransferase [Candidatus Gracilibacteria bacterium]